jgi:hypothetical protein
MGVNTFPTPGSIPFGATAGRPASPTTGQPFFNGTVGVLEVANTAGAWVSIASQTVPAPTVAPTVTQSTSGTSAVLTTTANVSFSAVSPAGNITVIDSYVVSAATTGGTVVSTATTTSLSCVITGLTSGTQYNFTYVAKSGSASSAASPATLFRAPTVNVFTSSTTYTIPYTGTWTLIAIGGGGGSGSSGNVANGGGSGRLTAASTSCTAGDSIVVTLGGGGGTAGDAGGATTMVRGGVTLSSGAGGDGGRGSGTGAGGSGGGGGGDGSGATYPGPGGYWGSNGNKNPGGGSAVGAGQLGVAYGLGTDTRIPSGGAGSYAGNNGTAWAGLYGSGGGLSAAANENGIQRGGGAGGATWAQPGRSGNTGIAAIVG